MQEQIKRVEKEISFSTFSSKNEILNLVIAGRGDLKTFELSEKSKSISNKELAAAILSVHNDATEQRQTAYKAKMGPYAEGKLPPGLNMPGIAALQETMNTVKEQVSNATFEGGRSNGVMITINGKDEWLGLTIDESLMDEDTETIVDVIRAAYNVAAAKKDEYTKAVFKEKAKDILPFGARIPGLF